MKRLQLVHPDMLVSIDGEHIFLDAAQWFSIKLDDHIDHVFYDDALGTGEIQWCPNPLTGRMPANDKFTKGTWSPYFDQGTIDRALAMHAQRKEQMKAEAAARVAP